MFDWDYITYQDADGGEQKVIRCYRNGHIVGQVNWIVYTVRPNAREAVIRQALKRPAAKPRLQNDDNAQLLTKAGVDWDRSWNAVVFPDNAAPVTIGAFHDDAEACVAVESWWEHWLGRVS